MTGLEGDPHFFDDGDGMYEVPGFRLRELRDAEAEVERLRTWQRAYAKGRTGLVEQADQDFARAERAEAEVMRLREALREIAAADVSLLIYETGDWGEGYEQGWREASELAAKHLAPQNDVSPRASGG